MPHSISRAPRAPRPPRAVAVAAAVAVTIAAAAAPAPARADDQVQADIAWGWVTLELGIATGLVVASQTKVSGDRLALIGPLASVSAAIAGGFLADRLDAPMAGANAVHGALFGGGELMLIGALIDGDRRGPRLGRAALTFGLLGAAGGAAVGATRIPTGSYSMAWMYAPLSGAAAGVIVAGGWELFCPSDHAARRAATVVAVGAGLGLAAGWLMAEHHVGAIYPEARGRASRPRLIAISGRF
jgi:hypothetical protein